MDEDGALFDSGFDGAKPFRDTPESGGISLEAALRDFGPAALDDLIPRVRRIAATLDTAHAHGVVHGALHPSKVIITDDSTSIVRGTSSSKPYIAPEVVDCHPATAASDQFALAAITYEWLFGRPIDRPAARPVEVRSMPGADRATLSSAFTRALAPDPNQRFDSCLAFCDQLASAVVPELPLLAPEQGSGGWDQESGIGQGQESGLGQGSGPSVIDQDWPSADEARIVAEETHVTAAFDSTRADVLLAPELDAEIDPHEAFLREENPVHARRDEAPDFDAIDRGATSPEPVTSSWQSAVEPPMETSHQAIRPSGNQADGSARFGGAALILATIVGAIFGFAAGYMARPRALQSGPAQEMASPAGATSATSATGATGVKSATEAPIETAAPRARAAQAAPVAPAARPTGRLLIRSNPAGAAVSVDGVAKGVTPLALRDLELGTRSVGLTRPGYIAETRTVAMTRERPSRTLDVKLTAAASATAGRNAPTVPKPVNPPARVGVQSAKSGALVVESRPIGASVSINGTARGITPMTINDLAPGDYRIVLTLRGFQNFATTVRVVAGERVRAAASLTAQEQE